MQSPSDTPSRSASLTPPIELIAENNIGIHDPANVMLEYHKIARYIATVLKNQAHLTPSSHVLDVGCGLGRVAAPLVDFLTTGSYTGIDVVKSSIDWCKEAYKNLPNFKFIHADLHSVFYNPTATTKSEEYVFPFEDNTFDVTWSASLFTHMLLPAVDNYLGEISRTLKPGGYTWNSYLLLDEISEPLVLGPRSDGRRMMHEVEGGRIGYKDRPEHVVGLRLDRVLALHEKHGLKIETMQLSNWSGGRDTKYVGQDVLVARKV